MKLWIVFPTYYFPKNSLEYLIWKYSKYQNFVQTEFLNSEISSSKTNILDWKLQLHRFPEIILLYKSKEDFNIIL